MATHYRIELSQRAGEAYRKLPLFERQLVLDRFESMGIGQNLRGDFSETLSMGDEVQIVVVSGTAVSFQVDYKNRLVRVLVIESADC